MSATNVPGEPGALALFSWADFDGDSRLDLVAISAEGTLQLLANVEADRFEDVTERTGLAGITNAALALSADYDGDLWLDLFVGVNEGASHLFRNEGGIFVDRSAESGLWIEGTVRSAHWLDHDGDGRLDLHVVTAERSELFRGLEGGFFVPTELPAPTGSALPAPSSDHGSQRTAEVSAPSDPLPGGEDEPSGRTSGDPALADDRGVAVGRVPLLPTAAPRTESVVVEFPPACASTIRDQANPGMCLQASSTPTLGRLYPISTNLFVAAGGNVGIGTTSPSARLHVAGTARVSDTLTLNPSGDQALDVSTGSIYKGGTLFLHTKGGIGNTALGQGALTSVTSGYLNTASGYGALRNNTTGFANTASGHTALRSNTSGNYNTATGSRALYSNTTGGANTAMGYGALYFNTAFGNTACGSVALVSNTTGFLNTASGLRALAYNTIGDNNTALGSRALGSNTTGDSNIALGSNAGYNLTTGNNNIAIGNSGVGADSLTTRIGTSQTRAFIAGIRGATTVNANAIPVLIDSAGQLGTVSSSRRFKKDVADMGEATERLLELRPVVFRYKEEQVLPEGGAVPLEYGLIAEEVAEIYPELVVYDEEGLPFTVKYHLLSSMLLNELKRLDGAHARELEELRSEFEARLAALESRASSTRPAVIPAGNR